jgi:hypothetical protein
MLGRAALVLVLALLAAPAPAAHAADQLAAPDQRLAWTDAVDTNERVEFSFDVALPAGVWDTPGAVQVGIHWAYDSFDFRDVDLHVVGPGGTAVTTSNGSDEDSEVVHLPNAINGTYRAIVVGMRAKDLPFDGWVEVERDPAATPLRDLLPNLVAQSQRHLGFFPEVGQGSCLSLERSEDGAKRCLRLEQSVANVGSGPMQIRYGVGSDPGALQPLFQLIRRSDGTLYERTGDQWEYHQAHQHFHYKNFALSQLWPADEHGRILGSAPLRSGRKVGFCLLDVENIWWQRHGDAAKFHNSCNPSIQGIGVGWADVYNYSLHGQYIDVAGVPDGHYVIETIADPPSAERPGGTILETDETDNSAFVHIRIGGETVKLLPFTPPAPAPSSPPAAPVPGGSLGGSPGAQPPGLVLRVTPRSPRARSANRRRSLTLAISATERLRDLRATLVAHTARARPVGRGRLARLDRRGRLRIRLSRRLTRGSHLLHVSATDAAGRPRRVSIALTVR